MENENIEPLDLIEVPGMDTPPELADKVTTKDDDKIELVDTVEELQEKQEKKTESEEEKEQKPVDDKKKYELNDEDYSKSVQRRLAKATAKQRSAEERAAAAEARNDLLREELERIKNESFESREKAITEKRTAAVTEGDLEIVTQLSDELMNLRLERQKPVVEERKPVQQPPQDDEPNIDPAAQTWLDRNLWYYDPKNAEQARKAEQIQNELLANGWEFSDELYSELDKRLKGAARATEERDPTPTGKPTPAKPGHIAAPSPGGDNPNPKPKAGQFTQRDADVMRTFKLDPNDPKQRAAYLKRRSQ